VVKMGSGEEDLSGVLANMADSPILTIFKLS
jgi:hypothetical protein